MSDNQSDNAEAWGPIPEVFRVVEARAAIAQQHATCTYPQCSGAVGCEGACKRRQGAAIAQQPAPDCGHGWVYPRADGVKARCGGPAICPKCRIDAAAKQGAAIAQPAEPCPIGIAPANWALCSAGTCATCQAERAIAQPVAPEGWKLVPVKPTSAMLDAAVQAICYGPEGGFTRIGGPGRCWAVMLAAAPAAPTARQPLTPEQIVDLIERADGCEMSDFEFARAIERAHGITQEGE